MMNHPQSPPEVVSQPASCVQQLEVDLVPGVALAPVIQLLKVDPLPVGSQHEVFVSHMIDGAQSFMIQLKENRLQKLMELMNASGTYYESVELCYAGFVCLGRYSKDGQLGRAVVTKVLTDGADLLFVDSGISETVPFSKIYKLPAQFLEEPIMALQFTLAGVSTSPALLTQKGREMFEELIQCADSLLLHVSEPDIQGKQYCELYISDEEGAKINIRQKILDEVKLVKPDLHDRLTFKKNSTNNVIVTHTETPMRFFVRLNVAESPFDALVDSFADYCKSSPVKNIVSIEEVHDNMAVWFKFRFNDQSRWGRGLVVGEPMDDGYVDIFDVDSGRTETTHFSKLKVMNNERLAKLPRQAVECRLDLDEDFALSDEVVTAFKRMVYLKLNKMVVIDVLPENVLLVDLFNHEDRCMKDKLLSKFGAVDPTMLATSKRPASATPQKTDVENKCGHIPDNRGAEIDVMQKERDKKEIVKRVEYPKQSFKVNSTKDIYISHVDTPIRFFVNVDEEDADQSDLSDFRHGISIYNDYFVHSPMKFISDEKVHDNLAVWCQTECGDEWERGLVVGEPSKNGRVNVFCVDNGETRQVFSDDLRLMKNGVYARIPMEAVECRLDLDADFATRTDVVKDFKASEYYWDKMKVINVLPDNVLLVDLFDEEGQNAKDMLLSKFSVVKSKSSKPSKRLKSDASQKTGTLDVENKCGPIPDYGEAEINVKQKGCDKVEVMKPVQYKMQSFEVNSSNDVSVTYVETPLRFFVKLNVNESLDTSKIYDLQEISSIEEVHDNMAVWFVPHFDRKKRRGLVVGEPINKKYVVVFDVDSGCTDTVYFKHNLKVMNNGQFTELPRQAVECRLDMDEDFALRDEVVATFVGIAYRRLNKMKVIKVLPENVLLVDVFDEAGQSLKDLLLRAFDVVKPISPLANDPLESAVPQKAGIQ